MQVFNVNWSKLVVWLLPINLRKRKIVSYLVALINPIKKLYIDFLLFRNRQLYEAEINGQVIQLERILNDTFDPIDRRIFITDGDYYTPPTFYEEWKNQPVIFNDEGNNANPIYYDLGILDETVSFNFFINVPTSIYFEKPRIKALVNQYKVCGRTFDVQIII